MAEVEVRSSPIEGLGVFALERVVFDGSGANAFCAEIARGSLTRCAFVNGGVDGVRLRGSVATLKGLTFEGLRGAAISAMATIWATARTRWPRSSVSYRSA